MPVDIDTISMLNLKTLKDPDFSPPAKILQRIGTTDAVAVLDLINNNDPYGQIPGITKKILNERLGPLAAAPAVPAAVPAPPAAGGRGHKGTRKMNPVLKSWVAFVKKVQHEENLTYPKAMKRASKRKSEWKRGGTLLRGGILSPAPQVDIAGGAPQILSPTPLKIAGGAPQILSPTPLKIAGGAPQILSPAPATGGSRRHRGSKKRHTKRRR